MPNEYTLRNYKPSDATGVVDMLNAGGHPRAVVDGAGNIRLIRYVPVDSKKVVAEDRQGKIVGYAYVADKENSFVFETGGGVHSQRWNTGIGSSLLEWAQEEAAKQSGQRAPEGVRCVLQSNVFAADTESRKLFEDAGFAKVREWVHYEIQLGDAPIKVEIPNGMSIRMFDLDNDWDAIGPVMDEAFKDHWGSYSLPETDNPESEEEEEIPQDFSYSNADGYCFVLMAGKEVAGGILCNARLVEFKDTGRVGSVFVHPKFRRRGVGRALMLAAFNAFHQNNMSRVILDTDSQSFTDSAKFYTSLGMKEYRREFLYEKEIRPGVEIRRLER